MSNLISTSQPVELAPSNQSLAGLCIVITRAEERAGSLAEQLRMLGATPIIYPTITFAPPYNPHPLDAALEQLAAGAYNWLALTSATAVRMIADRSAQLWGHTPHRRQSAFTPHLNVAAVGSTTATACIKLLGITPTVTPAQFLAAELAQALGDMRNQRLLLANADIAQPTLEERLRAAGAIVDRVIAYHTIPATANAADDMPSLLTTGVIDVITFTSGSTVRYFMQRIGPAAAEHARRTIIACIGPQTAIAAREVGLLPTIIAHPATEAGLIVALSAHIAQSQR